MSLNSHIPGKQVRLRCNGEMKSTKDIEIIDTVKTKSGQDAVTFICPNCQQRHQSLAFGF